MAIRPYTHTHTCRHHAAWTPGNLEAHMSLIRYNIQVHHFFLFSLILGDNDTQAQINQLLYIFKSAWRVLLPFQSEEDDSVWCPQVTSLRKHLWILCSDGHFSIHSLLLACRRQRKKVVIQPYLRHESNVTRASDQYQCQSMLLLPCRRAEQVMKATKNAPRGFLFLPSLWFLSFLTFSVGLDPLPISTVRDPAYSARARGGF